MPEAAAPIRVLIADDHAIFRAGLRKLIEAEPGLEVAGEARDGEEAIKLSAEVTPDILLLDLAMPGVPGLEVLRHLGTAEEGPKVIVLAAEVDKRQMTTVLRNGAHGVVLKESATTLLFKSIRMVMEGQYWVGRDVVGDLVAALAESTRDAADRPFGLTPRELEIVKLVAGGLSNKEIAGRCGVTLDTVKHHITNVFDKTGVSNRVELAVFASNHSL